MISSVFWCVDLAHYTKGQVIRATMSLKYFPKLSVVVTVISVSKEKNLPGREQIGKANKQTILKMVSYKMEIWCRR